MESPHVEAANSRRDTILGVSITFLSLAWVAVLLRTYVRAFMMRNYGWDDAVMLLAVISYTMYTSFNILCVSYGFGNPYVVLSPPAVLAKLASYLIATFALYAATMIILKISLGIFYLRIAIEKWQRWTVYITVGVSTIFGTYYFFAAIFQCGNPTHFLRNVVAGKCSASETTLFGVNMTAGVINAVSDLILAVLPISLIRKAAMPKPAKISACAVLLLGSVGSAVSVVRLVYIRGLTYGGNFFESGVEITIWSELEAGLGIVAVSLVTLRPMFRCCIDNTRRAITPSLGSSGRRKKQSNLSSTGNSTDVGMQEFPPRRGGAPARPPRPTTPLNLQSPRESRSRPNSAGWSQIPEPQLRKDGIVETINSNVTRVASLHHGKVHWKEDRTATPPLPPPIPPLALQGRQDGAPRNNPAQIPNDSPPESPILPPYFKEPPRRPVRPSRAFSMPKMKSPTWPKPPSWPKSPSRNEMPPPLRHVVSQWKPPNQRPGSMSNNTAPFQSPYPSGMTFGKTGLGPYESYYGAPPGEEVPFDLSSYGEPYQPALPNSTGDYVPKAQATYQPGPQQQPYHAYTMSDPSQHRQSVAHTLRHSIEQATRESVSQPVHSGPPENEIFDRRYKRRGFAHLQPETEEIGLNAWRVSKEV